MTKARDLADYIATGVSGTELDILDGLTTTTAELNIMDGVTATTAELNILDGVTSTAAELNILDGVTATATELNLIDGVTATTAELNILDGVTSTAAELNILDGSAAGTIVNSKGVVYSSGGQVNATTLAIAGTAITSTAAELNILDGVTSTAAELNILDGVTSSAAELNYNDITTLGTVQASKVVTADANGDVKFPDGEKAIFGAGSDLNIWHDGNHSNVRDSGTGDLRLQGVNVSIQNNTGGENMATFGVDGAVQLYYDNAVKLATTATGVAITGAVKPTTYQETYVASSAASTVTLDLATATSFSLTMDQATTFAFSNPPGSGTAFSFTLFLTQHSSAVAITWPNTVDWAGGSAPDAAGANELQAYAFFTRDGGTTYYGFLGGTAIG